MLRCWNTTRKFVAIKVFLVLLIYEEPMVRKIVEKASIFHQSCFGNVGFYYSWEHVEADWWFSWLMVLHIPMILLLRYAFPRSELLQEFPEHHTDFLHMAVKSKNNIVGSDIIEDETGSTENSSEEV